MITYDVLQRSEDWARLRLFLPTASDMDRVVKPGMGREYYCQQCGTVYERPRKWCGAPECKAAVTHRLIVKPSEQQDGYIYKLIAQSIIGREIGPMPTLDMDRGVEREDRALADYEFYQGVTVQKIGFVTTDDRLIGCSPDGLVGDDGLVEAKSPKAEVHIRHLITGDLADDHKVQVNGQMLVTGRRYCDVISYCPEITIEPLIVIRVERDEEYIAGMNTILVQFVEKLHRTRAELIAKYGDVKQAMRAPSTIADFDAYCRPVV